MNYSAYGFRKAKFGEITMDGTVTADNVMEKLKEFHSDSAAIAELQSDKNYDFGAMAPGTKGTHEFVIKNTGAEPLKLELGASTCKCTLGSLKDSELMPGESTSVELEWTVSSDKKTFSQSAELRTNDPTQPAIRLQVSGLVIREIEFEPKEVSFGEVLSGDEFQFTTKMYSYYETQIEPTKVSFGSEELTKLSDFKIEPFEVSDADGVHKQAKQGFNVITTVQPGLRQGPMVTTMNVGFKNPDYKAPTDATATNNVDDKDQLYYASAELAGRVIGSLTMIESSKLKSTSGGGYYWSLGRLDSEDSLEFKALVALKGSEKDTTNLTIGEVYPSDVIQAEFDAPLGKGSMQLFPLKLKLTPGDKTIDLLGKNKDDFGWVWIESDNPKVSRMRVAVKVLIEPRP
ncbi:DUF1573 domain-containing protein [Stieleria tagensis]|uniref:DUF1573 domain-containing protein n=1 Tax=Stieleria tagensis TaxID=2956795 RepID=UPI00209A93ED|nr:DUF1573 domain-containing protein [Stieleria tagensis]